MSTGIVICSICHRELHQDGDRMASGGWRHCEDKTPKCPLASVIYPDSTNKIKGKWCGRDRELFGSETPDALTVRRTRRNAVRRDRLEDLGWVEAKL